MDPMFNQQKYRYGDDSMNRLKEYTKIEEAYIAARHNEPNTHHEAIRWKFPNGYGASVACSSLSNYVPELAVLKENSEGQMRLCYETRVTSDVIPRVSVGDVQSLLTEIKNL